MLWSKNQKSWGPFIVSRSFNENSVFRLLLDSGDEKDDCHLIITLFSVTLVISLPNFLLRRKHYTLDGIEDHYQREYGFTFDSEIFILRYGVQTDSSATTKAITKLIPWNDKRLKFCRLIKRDGTVHVEGTTFNVIRNEEYLKEVAVEFPIIDEYDSTRLHVKAYLYETVYAHGTGNFKWLSWFIPDRIVRRLNVEFSEEFGTGKSTWKGGILEASGPADKNETLDDALDRYIEEKGGLLIN